MSNTRSKGEASVTNFTDDPKRIGKNKSRKKNKNMPNAETAEATQQPEAGDKNHPHNPDDNEEKTKTAEPTNKMYLPDLNSTPLKNGLNCGLEDKVMVECPKLKQYFGVDTFLVQKISA